MAFRFLQRRGLAIDWAAQNPILGDGEIGFEKDTKIIKVGDGVTAWNDLTTPYMNKSGGIFTGAVSLIPPTQPEHAVRLSDIGSLGLGLREVVPFLTSGTFIKASYSWLRMVRVIVIGAGASGEGISANSYNLGHGGASGGVSFGIFDVSTLTASETVTVGTKGLGVALNFSGNNGGNSVFKGITCYGGTFNGLGGLATGGYMNIPGKEGIKTRDNRGGIGGDSHFGFGADPGAEAVSNQGFVGLAGKGYGGGGSGAVGIDTHPARAGGAGAPGAIFFELYA